VINPASDSLSIPEMLLSTGMSFVCSHCDHMIEAFGRGWSRCRESMNGRACGGPMVKMSFPLYSGVLKRNLQNVCFVCGKKPDLNLKMNGGGILGVCEEHMDIVKTYGRVGERPSTITEREIILF